jgi:hypothetical protein
MLKRDLKNRSLDEFFKSGSSKHGGHGGQHNINMMVEPPKDVPDDLKVHKD